MLEYELFLKLYHEAETYSDIEFYIAERGWQEWMDEYVEKDAAKISEALESILHLSELAVKEMMDRYVEENRAEKITKVLESIFYLSKISIRQMRELIYPSRTVFAVAYDIPLTTIRGRELGNRKVSNFDKTMIAYTIFIKNENSNAKIIRG